MTSMFKTPKTPTPAPTPVMPTADDAMVKAAKKKKIAQQQMTSGRMSTFLSSDNNTRLGG